MARERVSQAFGVTRLLTISVSQDLPVMIWIYGGAFLMGAGHGANFLDIYLYDGEEIATRGNVIVVTFNYRVGPLGFLSTGDANLPGLMGIGGAGGGTASVQDAVSSEPSRGTRLCTSHPNQCLTARQNAKKIQNAVCRARKLELNCEAQEPLGAAIGKEKRLWDR